VSQFEAGLQRLILALALRGEMLERAPGALVPEAFGDSGSPRQRIAQAITTYWGNYRARPSQAEMEQAVAETRLRLAPTEGELLAEELAAVLDVSLPENPAAVYDRARTWADVKRAQTELARAMAALEASGASALPAVRETLSRVIAPPDEGAGELIQYMATFDERVREWRSGLIYGDRIPTGIDMLDTALTGGPTKKETWYLLAPPKGMKTTFLLRFALAASRRQWGVYVSTFEMQAKRMAMRMDRGISGQTKEELAESTEMLERSMEAARSVSAEIYIDARRAQEIGSVENVKRQVDGIRKRGGKIDLVILDYLNIMGALKAEKEKRHELAKVSREIAQMGKDLDVAIWTAALVNRKAVGKRIIRKTDIAEAFEVVAVADGMIAICCTKAMIEAGYRSLYIAAAREEQDETPAGSYAIDPKRMTIRQVAEADVDRLEQQPAAQQTPDSD
jgi:KaiC/GvpD/RAD55 family RecA-like ATPase